MIFSGEYISIYLINLFFKYIYPKKYEIDDEGMTWKG
jgi:hypothetical protein